MKYTAITIIFFRWAFSPYRCFFLIVSSSFRYKENRGPCTSFLVLNPANTNSFIIFFALLRMNVPECSGMVFRI